MQKSVATKSSPHFSAVNVLIIGLASEDCYVVLCTPHNDSSSLKPFLMRQIRSFPLCAVYNKRYISKEGNK